MMNQVLDLKAPAPASQSAQKCGNMIAVASGKGGVGKTWLAVTLSHALARAGRKTLLFDGDLGLANVDVQLGLTAKHDLGGVLTGRYSLARAATGYESGSFDVIVGRSGSGNLANLPSDKLNALSDDLAAISPDYHHVVLDLGAGVDRTVRRLAARAGMCLVVTTDEPTALTDAYALIKLTLAETREADLRIVVNIAESARHGERTYATLLKACESFLSVSPPLAGIVRRDSRVKDSIRNQTPLLTRHPNATAANDIELLARSLMEAT